MIRNVTLAVLIVALSLCVGLRSQFTAAETPPSAEDAKDKTAATQPTTAPTTRPLTPAEMAAKEAMECYERIATCYLNSQLDKAKAELKLSGRHMAKMTPQARKDLMYLRRALPTYRPVWWKNCRSSSNVSFRAKIWNRSFTANYMPSSSFGFQAPVGIKDGEIQVIVSWQPNMVDNPGAFNGPFAEGRNLTRANVVEAIIWHELGHNYITKFLPLQHVITLYNEHHMLFTHLQEFYADMTTLYHASPRAALAMLWTRVSSLRYYSEAECHDRASHAIGALLLADMLSKPDKWPSIHFPPKVPESRIELNTLVYALDKLDPKWSIGEDQALRVMVKKFIFSQGEKVLRSRGTLVLPNRQSFKLMATDDRDLQVKRDAWVAGRLKAIIASGRADKPSKEKASMRLLPGGRIEIIMPGGN